MKYQVEINIMPLKELLDPQGKAVEANVKNLDLNSISNVRIGKHISISVEAENSDEARAIATKACEKLLANPVMEYFELEVEALS